MALSSDLVSQFAKIVNDDKKTNNESTVYGTVVDYNNKKYVKIDGSDQMTPVSSTTDMEVGERVTVMIKNHTATVTGNISSPSARTDTVKEVEKKVEAEATKITEFEIAIGKKVDTEELNAQTARIDTLVSENVTIKGKLDAAEAEIDDIFAENVEISGKLTAAEAEIDKLETNMLTVDVAKATYAEIKDLQAATADIRDLEADFVTVNDTLTAHKAEIDDLEAKKLSATDAEIKYAEIDFANIDMAAVEKLFSESGIIKDLVVDNGSITGELVGVTIKGDIIEGGTVIAEKLVVKGTDGLYYKLNTDGESVETAQTEYNSLNGSVITAKSITATKISVEDLVAFGATIGGFHITSETLYSGVKATVGNPSPGVYLDKYGQVAFGDGSNFLMYYLDGDIWKFAIAASSIYLTSKQKTIEDFVDGEVNTVADRVTEVESDISTMNGEISLKASKTEVTTAINEIQIGGRNLLRHTSQMPITDGYYDTNGIGTFGIGTLEDTGEGIKLTFDENGRGSMAVPLVSEGAVDNGDTVTLSFDYRGDLVHFGTFYYIQKTEPNVAVTGFPNTNASPTEWKHYQHTFSSATANDRINYTTLLFYDPGIDHANTWIEVKKDSLKLELGNKATDWTPAPEDQQAVVDTVAGNLNASIGDIQTSLDSTNSNLSDLEHDYNATYEIVTENSTKISELLQTAEGWTMSFETLNTTVTELNGKLTSEVNERYEYIRFENGDIYLGKRPEVGEDDLQLVISNEKISFNLNGTEVAYFSDDALYVTTVHVTRALRFGNFEFAERSNGNMGLRWVGES